MVTGKLRVDQIFIKSPSGWAVAIDSARVAASKEKMKSTTEKFSPSGRPQYHSMREEIKSLRMIYAMF